MARTEVRGPSDESLVEAAKRGEVRALEALLDRHQGKVLRVLGFLGVPAQDREDVAQDIFVRVFRHLDGFRRGRPFGGWLYRMTVNAAHDYRGRRSRLIREEAPWGPDMEAEKDLGPGPAESYRQQELLEALETAMEDLSERERAVFALKELEGLETGEVARTLGITSITVRRHLARARKRLKALLGD